MLNLLNQVTEENMVIQKDTFFKEEVLGYSGLFQANLYLDFILFFILIQRIYKYKSKSKDQLKFIFKFNSEVILKMHNPYYKKMFKKSVYDDNDF